MSEPRPQGARRRGRAAGLALGGLALGLALSEGAFWWRDRGAFPHLNVYAPDPDLAVRLVPGETQRFALPGDPVTQVRINAAGLRGALPPRSDGEIIVVGDSQVFGLGVDEHETFSAELARLLGAPVVNAGVPTYGPLEYEVVVDRLLRERAPRTVVYVVNAANDLFEARHPNTERHAVWDGWAVRKETAPAQVRSFPGRDLLFRRSHLVHALRSFLYRQAPDFDLGFRSEGAASDLLDASQTSAAEHQRAEETAAARARELEATLSALVADELSAEITIEKAALARFSLFVPENVESQTRAALEAGARHEAYAKSRETPGDIVYRRSISAESERRADQTFTIVLNGAQVRREVEARLRASAEARAKEAEAQALLATFEQRAALQEKIKALRAAPAEIVRAWSPMTPLLRRVKERCDAAGARLVVVALPMDAQVSPDEAAKYGPQARVDLTPTLILLDDLVASASALGAVGVNPLEALRAAEPGAFLPNDLHLTPRGHAAVARAIAAALASSPR